MSVIEKQQALLQGVVLDESSLPETVLTLNDREVPFKIITGKGCQEKDGKLIVTKENAQARLGFDGLDESEIYLIIEGVKYEALTARARIRISSFMKTASSDTGRKVRKRILM